MYNIQSVMELWQRFAGSNPDLYEWMQRMQGMVCKRTFLLIDELSPVTKVIWLLPKAARRNACLAFQGSFWVGEALGEDCHKIFIPECTAVR